MLVSGPGAVLRAKSNDIARLIDILQWLPELDLGIGKEKGMMDVQAVAHVVQSWMDGAPVHIIAAEFPGKTTEDKVRKAGAYVHSNVAMTVSWGAHAYLRSLALHNSAALESSTPEEQMLPAYIQYGVHTPEAAIAGLPGIPRQFAEALGEEFREHHGSNVPAPSPKLVYPHG